MAQQTPQVPRQVTLERTFDAAIEDVWELWTSREGIESWWGPEGFRVKVHRLDLRRGGELAYATTATAPEQIDFLRKLGVPATTEALVTYTEVVPRRRLAFTQTLDFIPDVEPYEVATAVEFDATPQGVRMVLTFAAMHDENWTRMAVMGWESQLGKLAKLLER